MVQSEPDLATSDEITESLTEEMETTADAYAEEIVVCEDKVESYRQSESESDGNIRPMTTPIHQLLNLQ